jgi:hypothetical protein
MTRPARIAMALWFLLAIVVFNVTFDWNTRMAGHAFVQSQIAARQQGLPLQTINDGFRPMVRAAALDASKWLALIALGGVAAVMLADSRKRVHSLQPVRANAADPGPLDA